MWWQASTFPSLGRYPGPALFPQVVAASLMLASLALIGIALWRWRKTTPSAHPGDAVSNTHSQTDTYSDKVTATLNITAGLGLVVLFPVIQGRLGGWVALTLLATGTALLLRVKWLTALLVGIATSVVVTVAFRYLLGVPLG